jgi:hypothetical protein
MEDSALTEREIAQELRDLSGQGFEMSVSGMSALTTSDLHVGDEIDLSPVAHTAFLPSRSEGSAFPRAKKKLRFLPTSAPPNRSVT